MVAMSALFLTSIHGSSFGSVLLPPPKDPASWPVLLERLLNVVCVAALNNLRAARRLVDLARGMHSRNRGSSMVIPLVPYTWGR